MILPIFSSQIHNFYPHLTFHNIPSLPGLCNSVSVVCQVTCNTFHVILTDLNDFSVDFGVFFFLSTSYSECSPHFVSMAMHITESLPICICFIEFYFFFYLKIVKKKMPNVQFLDILCLWSEVYKRMSCSSFVVLIIISLRTILKIKFISLSPET